SHQIKDRTLGSKALRMRRDRDAAQGTLTETVPDSQRGAFTLSDDQVADLAAYGLRIQACYDYWPQDIEWALVEGQFYILQSRPITGVEFSWDADLESWQSAPDDDDTLWTRAFSDAVWTGAITPLMYSFRGAATSSGYYAVGNTL